MKKFTLLFAFFATHFLTKAQTPFPASTNYVYVGAAGKNASTDPLMVYTTSNPGSGQFNNGNAITGTTEKINGVGLNAVDNFLYGISFPNGAAVTRANMYRIGSDGVAVNVGNISAPFDPAHPAAIAFINTTSGVVTPNNTYYFTAYLYKGSPTVIPYQVGSFDVFVGEIPAISTLPANSTAPITSVKWHKLDYSNPVLTTAFQSFLNQFDYQNPGYSDGGFEDIAFSPVDGKMYSYVSYPDANGALVGRLVSVDPATWTVTPVGTNANTTPGTEMAGLMFDAAAKLYMIFTNGQYGTVDLTTGALSPLVASNLPLSNGNLRGDLAANPTPDYTPLISIDALSFAANESRDFAVQILEQSGGINFGSVSFRIPLPPSFTFTYGTATTTVNVDGGTTVNNSDWDITQVSGYILCTLKAGKTIPPFGLSSVGFTITRKAGSPGGSIQNFAAVIVAHSGGDNNSTDNSNVVNLSTLTP